MRRRFAPLVALLAAAATGEARAYDYNRKIQVDWEPHPEAARYEVEWFTGAGCENKAGERSVTEPSWTQRLPAGNYCVRMRAVGAGDRPGQWSDFQRLDVRPKPPREIRQKGATYSWDEIPYARSYLVEVLGPGGKVLHSTEPSKPEFTIPGSIIRAQKPGDEELIVSVRTRAEGVAPSSPSQQGYYLEVVETREGKLRRLPGQPAPRAITPDEAVDRFVIGGERPLPPTRDEWALAKTPEQREILRQRAIASERVELVERLERRRAPGLSFSFAAQTGDYGYRNRAFSDYSRDYDRSSLQYRAEARWNEEGKWGAFARFWTIPVSTEQTNLAFTGFSLGPERHFAFDPYGESVLSVGFGPVVTLQAILVNIEGSREAALWAPTLGVGLHLRYRLALGNRWALETAFEGFGAWEQDYFKGAVNDLSADGAALRLGPVYRVSPELKLQAGYALQSVSGRAHSSQADFRVDAKSVFLQLGYATTETEGRSLAAERSFVSDLRRKWELRLELPFVTRHAGDIGLSSFSVGGDPTGFVGSSQGSGQRLEVELARDFGGESGWRAGVGAEAGRYRMVDRDRGEGLVRAFVGPRGPLLGRADASWSLLLGGVRRHVVAEDAIFKTPLTMHGTDAEAAGRIERAWTGDFSSRLDLRLALPLAVGTSLSDFSSDGSGRRSGLNLAFSLGGALGYRLLPGATAWLGYEYHRLRYSLTKDAAHGISISEVVLNEGRIRLGVSVRW
jgi:hypothetical protein